MLSLTARAGVDDPWPKENHLLGPAAGVGAPGVTRRAAHTQQETESGGL